MRYNKVGEHLGDEAQFIARGAMEAVGDTLAVTGVGLTAKSVARNLSDFSYEFGARYSPKITSNGVDLYDLGRNYPLSLEKIDEIISIPKGERPSPNTYLSQEYIDLHLEKFDDGIVRFTSKASFEKRGTYGPDNGFTMPKSEFERIMFESKGDLSVIEKN